MNWLLWNLFFQVGMCYFPLIKPKKNCMKNTALYMAVVALLACPSVCVPSYLVQLKNGNQLIVDQYWEEGGIVRFYSYGGAVGIPKDLVEKVGLFDVSMAENVDEQAFILSPKPPDGIRLGIKTATPPKKREENERLSSEFYERERRRLTREVDKAVEAFRIASSNHDGNAKRAAMADMTRASEQLLHLTDAWRQQNRGTLPNWWTEL